MPTKTKRSRRGRRPSYENYRTPLYDPKGKHAGEQVKQCECPEPLHEDGRCVLCGKAVR